MAINSKPCGGCVHFDQQFKMVSGTPRKIYGFCAKLSKYPAKDPDGKHFPDGVERVGPDEGAKMKVVYETGVQQNCLFFLAK